MVETRKTSTSLDSTMPPPGTTTLGSTSLGTTGAVIDPSARKVVTQTSSGNTYGVGVDPHHTGVLPSVLKGDVPSNQQIDVAMNQAKQSLETVQPQLSSQGRRIAQDTEEVIESAQRMLHNKNQDEKLQRLVREAAFSGKQAARQGTMATQQMRGDQYDTNALTRDTFENAKDLTLYFIRHPEFRQFSIEIFQFFRSVLQDIQMQHGPVLKQAVSQDTQHVAQNLQQSGTLQQQPTTFQQGTTLPSTQFGTTGLQQQQHPVTQGLQQSSTANVLSNVAHDMKSGNLGDERLKWTLEQRLENILFTLSQNPQYNKIINNLFLIFEAFRDRKDRLKADPTLNVQQQPQSQMMLTDAWNLLAEFVGQQQLQEFEALVWSIYSDLRNDQMASQFFFTLKDYMRVSVENPEMLTDDYRRQQGKMLMDQANVLFRIEQDRHRDSFNRLVNLMINMVNSIKYDSDTMALSQSVGRLAKDMIFDEQGRPDIFVAQESLDQLKRMIIPLVQKQLETIPLPMIEGSNDKYDFRVQNLVMNGRDILPDYFDLKLVNNVSLGSKQSGNRVHAKLKLKANNIRVAFPNMQYYYKRKKMPRLEDEGIADVALLGSGLNLRITWHLYIRENKPLTFELARVKVFIDKMDITVKQSRHKLINKIALKIFGGAIKRRVSSAIVEKIRDTLTPFNNQLNDFFRREREGHRLRERANVRLQHAYTAKQEGGGITQKLKNTVQNVAQPLLQQQQQQPLLTQQPLTTQQPMMSQQQFIGNEYINVSENKYDTVLRESPNFSNQAYDMGSMKQNLPTSGVDKQPHPFEQTKDILEEKMGGRGVMREDSGRWDSSWIYEPDWSSTSSSSSTTQPTSNLGLARDNL